jgi:hypothetical protein
MPPLMAYPAALHTIPARQLLRLPEVDKRSLYTTDFGYRKDLKCVITLLVVAPGSGPWRHSHVAQKVRRID